MSNNHSRRLALALVLVAVGIGSYALLKDDHKPAVVTHKGGRDMPVRVAQVTTRSIPIRIQTIGTFEAQASVQVRSRVDGPILAENFTDGQIVKKGDPLFRIDPRAFDAKVRAAEANKARDEAALVKAKSDFERYKSLSNKGYSSQQKYEEARASMNGLTATLRADQAAIDLAKLDLQNTVIRAPIGGRTGAILIGIGNLVKANDSQPLVVINQTTPILATFSVAERFLGEIKRRLKVGPVDVDATIPDSTRPAAQGRLVFVNNAVDTETGTIQLKAEFANPDGFFTPGQFVHVAIEMQTLKDAHVVPRRTVQQGRNGPFVFVVRPNRTVVPQNVTVGPSADGFVSVGTSLPVGATVVTDGQLRLFRGAKVAIREKKTGGATENGAKAGAPAGPAKAAR